MKKCNFEENKYTPCEMVEAKLVGTNGDKLGIGIIQVHNMKTGEDYNKGLIYKYGRKRKEVIVMNFCPACGVDITPK